MSLSQAFRYDAKEPTVLQVCCCISLFSALFVGALLSVDKRKGMLHVYP